MEAGFKAARVSPRMVYVDSTRPDLVDGFIKKTFTAMMEGVRATAIASGIVEPTTFDAGIQALYRTAEADGVFCYTFFKAVSMKEGRAELRDPAHGSQPIHLETNSTSEAAGSRR